MAPRMVRLMVRSQVTRQIDIELARTRDPQTKAALTFYLLEKTKAIAIQQGVHVGLTEHLDRHSVDRFVQEDLSSGGAPDDQDDVQSQKESNDSMDGEDTELGGESDLGDENDVGHGHETLCCVLAAAPNPPSVSSRSLSAVSPTNPSPEEPSVTGRTRDSPITAGGSRGYGLLVHDRLQLALTRECTPIMALTRQAEFARGLEDIRWQYKGQWLRLHSHAVHAWMQHLTSDVLSIKGIERINRVMCVAPRNNDSGFERQSVSAAEERRDNDTYTGPMRAFFGALASVLKYRQPARDAYTNFQKRVNQCALHARTTELEEECGDPDSPSRAILWNALGYKTSGQGKMTRGKGARGKGVKTLVKQFVLKTMGWKEEQYTTEVRSITPLAKMVARYGIGFCLVVEDNFVHM